MAINFTWEVLSINQRVNAMLVEYTNTDTGVKQKVNLSIPLADQDVNQYIIDNAPLLALDAPKIEAEYAHIELGHSGSATAELPTPIITTSTQGTVVVSDNPAIIV